MSCFQTGSAKLLQTVCSGSLLNLFQMPALKRGWPSIHPLGHILTLWIKGRILYCVGSGSPTAACGVLPYLVNRQIGKRLCWIYFVAHTLSLRGLALSTRATWESFQCTDVRYSFEEPTVSIGKQRQNGGNVPLAVDPWFCIVDSLGEHFKNSATQTPFLPVGTRFFESWIPGICSSEKPSGCPIPSKDQCKMFQKFFMGLQHSKKNKAEVVGLS